MNIYHNYSQLRDAQFYRSGFHLIIEANICVDAEMISCNQSLEITPILSSNQEKIELPFLLINGKHRHRAYKQMSSRMIKEQIEKTYQIYKEIKAGKDLYCRYRQELLYADWMENAVLVLQER